MGEEDILNGVMSMPATGGPPSEEPDGDEPRGDPGALLDEVMSKLQELRGLVASPQ